MAWLYTQVGGRSDHLVEVGVAEPDHLHYVLDVRWANTLHPVDYQGLGNSKPYPNLHILFNTIYP